MGRAVYAWRKTNLGPMNGQIEQALRFRQLLRLRQGVRETTSRVVLTR